MNTEHTIYMDYQATTPVLKSVVDAMLPYLLHDYGNPHSTDHIMGWKASKAVEDAKRSVAKAIGANKDEIIFTSGATESNNQAVISVARSISHKKKRILVGATEHKCIIESARYASKEYNLALEIIPVDKEGFIDIDAYKSLLDQDVGFVSVMMVNNEIGTIQDIKTLVELAKSYDAIFHCDAAQGLIATDIDVADLGVDLLSLSAHKIYGPKGIGALYIANELVNDLEPLLHGGNQQNGLRAGTLPTAQCVGFALACESLIDMSSERQRLIALKELFITSLLSSVELEINGPTDYSRCHPGNINLFFPSIDAHTLLMKLQPKLCASNGSACNSGLIDSSYVIRALGYDSERADNSIRFSIGSQTNKNEIMNAVKIIIATISD